ncbi:MAG: hypothetical protein ACRD2J_01480 [Thermoanaerobaculia bacterium]
MLRSIGQFLVVLIFAAEGALSQDCDRSPLILDLNGDGIRTSDALEPVWFDIDGDGLAERVAWTNPMTMEAFLWLDSNRNGLVDGGRELFGDATLLPWGTPAANGFEALRQYDALSAGGNDDAMLSSADAVWPFLKTWIDSDHDAISTPDEVRPLVSWHIDRIDLDYFEVPPARQMDGNGNFHRFRSYFDFRVRGEGSISDRHMIDDVFLRIVH